MHVCVGSFLQQIRFVWLVLVSFLLVSVFGWSHVELHLTAPSGAPCTRVGAGDVCVLKVVCQGNAQDSFPAVAGLNAFRLQGRSKNMSAINGVYSTTYLYHIRAPQPGHYSFGPVHIVVDGVTQTSNIVSLEVIDQKEAENERKRIEKAPLFLLRLRADETTVAVGQPVQGTLSLYCRADQHTISLDELVSPDWQALGIIIENREPKQSTTSIDGVQYTGLEWSWLMTPNKTGKMTIPACAASLRIPDDRGNHGIFSLFGSFKQQRVYSNAVYIIVKDLPACTHPVHALGSFTGIEATISSGVMQKDDAVMVQMAVTGKTEVKAFALQDIPDALRWYDSKKSVRRNEATGEIVTLFEYVLQGLEEGTWSVPEQIFYYYDTPHATYKKFKTGPLFVTVVPTAHTRSAHCPTDQQESTEIPEETNVCDTLLFASPWQPVPEQALSVWMMALCMAMPCIFFLIRYALTQRSRSIQGSQPVGKRRAFKHARKELQKAMRAGNVRDVYTIFLTLFALCLRTSISMVNQESIEHALQEAGMPEVQQKEWNIFFVRMMSMTYAHGKADEEIFFKQALQWLDVLYSYF